MHETQAFDTCAAPAATITLRSETPEDEAFLFTLYASVREEELEATGWAGAARDDFLQMQFRAMRRGYRSMFPQAQFSIIMLEGEPVGRLVLNRASDELRVVDITLLPAARGQGLGGNLLRSIVAEARHSGRRVRLHVLKGARAERLYERLGFRQINDAGLYEQMEWRPRKED